MYSKKEILARNLFSIQGGGGLWGKIIPYSLLAFIFYSLKGGGIRIFIPTEN